MSNILIVDDNVQLLETLEEYLRNEDFKVLTADNGQTIRYRHRSESLFYIESICVRIFSGRK